jgi:AcrR family transcriptional regulator
MDIIFMGIQERKEREKEHRKEEILDAARRIFFEKGLAASTMDEIAEAAELSKGTLYLYYGSKEDLYLGVMMRGMQPLYEAAEQIVGSNISLVEKLVRLGDSYVDFFHSNRSTMRIFPFFQNPQLQKQVSEEMRQMCVSKNQQLWEMLIGVLRKGMEEGSMRPDLNPVEVGIIIWTTITAMLIREDNDAEKWKTKHNVDFDHALDVCRTLIVESILTERGRKEFSKVKKEKKHAHE